MNAAIEHMSEEEQTCGFHKGIKCDIKTALADMKNVVSWKWFKWIIGGLCVIVLMGFSAGFGYVNSSHSQTTAAIEKLESTMLAGFAKLETKYEMNRNESLQQNREVRDDISDLQKNNALLKQEIESFKGKQP